MDSEFKITITFELNFLNRNKLVFFNNERDNSVSETNLKCQNFKRRSTQPITFNSCFFGDSYLMKKWSCFQNIIIQLGLCMLMLGISHSSS